MNNKPSPRAAMDRRHFLRYTWGMVGANVALALLPGHGLGAAPRFRTNPFTLGVASGDPTPDGIVLWTRLAPNPAEPLRLSHATVPVGWRVATDDRNDLKLDFKDPRAATVAMEFVTLAITTGGDATPYGPYYGPMVPYNPHIKYFEGDRRGHFMATVTPTQMWLDLRFITSVE